MDDLTPDQHQFIARLREVGGSSGNKSLRSRLSWGEKHYFDIQTELLTLEFIQRGRGRGGSVSIIENDSALPTVEVFSECELYAPLNTALTKWIRQHYGPNSFVWLESEIVCSKGGTRVGGTWRRADIAAMSVRAFQYSPDISVETFSFEVKTIANLDVPAIYETSENSTGATYGYLLVHRSARADRLGEGAKFLRLERAATVLGVGIICFDEPEDVETWDCELEAVRRPHDPALSDAYLRRTFSRTALQELSDHIRTAHAPGTLERSASETSDRASMDRMHHAQR